MNNLNIVTKSQLCNYEKHPKHCVPDIKNVDKLISYARPVELYYSDITETIQLKLLTWKGKMRSRAFLYQHTNEAGNYIASETPSYYNTNIPAAMTQ